MNKVPFALENLNSLFVVDLIGNSRYINSNMESIPMTGCIALSSYLSFGRSELTDLLKRKPHPNYIFQYQTEKDLYKNRTSSILHCGLLLNVLEPLILQSWKLKTGIVFPDCILPICSIEHLQSTINSIVLTESSYKWVYEGCISLNTLFEQWNLQFTESKTYENSTTLYSNYITYKDLFVCDSGFQETNKEMCIQVFNSFLDKLRSKHSMIKRDIAIIGVSQSGKSTLAKRIDQYYNLKDNLPFGVVYDWNCTTLEELTINHNTYNPNLYIVLSNTSSDLMTSFVDFIEKKEIKMLYFGAEFYEFKKSEHSKSELVWPRDDFLFSDCRFGLFSSLIANIGPCFQYDIPISYKKTEYLRIEAFKRQEESKNIKNNEEFLYDIPETATTSTSMRLIEDVLPILINGLNSIDLTNQSTALHDLSLYLMAKSK